MTWTPSTTTVHRSEWRHAYGTVAAWQRHYQNGTARRLLSVAVIDRTYDECPVAADSRKRYAVDVIERITNAGVPTAETATRAGVYAAYDEACDAAQGLFERAKLE